MQHEFRKHCEDSEPDHNDKEPDQADRAAAHRVQKVTERGERHGDEDPRSQLERRAESWYGLNVVALATCSAFLNLSRSGLPCVAAASGSTDRNRHGTGVAGSTGKPRMHVRNSSSIMR